jgi:hypothetical protein
MKPSLALVLGVVEVAALSLLPVVAGAQSLGGLDALGGGSVPSLTLDLSPPSPQPLGTVVVTPESTLIDLHDAVVSVFVNGTRVYEGNAVPVPVTLPGPGRATAISASATVAGQSYSASVTLFPGAVALVEEPLSSAPALYRGKPLAAEGGSVRLVAVPDFETAPGSALSASTLSYTWKQDGATLDAASGIGRSSIVLAAPLQYRTSSVEVSVASQDGAITGGATLALSPATPTLRLYADDPLEGILFDHALGGSLAVTGSEAALAAVPYSFAVDQGAPSINWFLDGAAVESGTVITLRPTGKGSGTASVSATAAPAAGSALTSAAALSISFGSSGGSSLLGL